MKGKRVFGAVIGLLALGAVGVLWAAVATAADQVSPAATKEAQEIFKTRCSTCHGLSGKGDGPAAAGLNPKPRNYTDEAWQKKTTDQTIEKAIVNGGPSVGLSPLMPPNPDLASKPEVVKGLMLIVRSFGGKN